MDKRTQANTGQACKTYGDGSFLIFTQLTEPSPQLKILATKMLSTNVGRLMVHGRTSACTDPEVERSTVKVTRVSSAPDGVRMSIRDCLFSSFTYCFVFGAVL